MSRENNRDRAIDQLLRQSAGDPSVPADAHACVDGETLAAWTAGTLRSVDAAAVEQHVADCGRCQAMLATLVRTTPVTAVAEAWWRRWHVRWLVPIASAATVAAIWVAIPSDERQRPLIVGKPDVQLKAPAEGAQPSLSLGGTSPGRETAIAMDDNARAKDEDRPADTVARRSNRADEKRVQKPARAEPDQGAAPAAVGESKQAGARQERVAEAAPPVPSVPASALPPAPPAAPLPAPALAKERDVLVSAARTRVMDIVSPDPAHRWRIVGGREVQHSTTGGAAWQAVALLSPEAMLTAGHAPTPLIVWLVGHGGAIFVITDPSHVVRVPFTEPVDLVSVRAIDDRQATVTAADGRTFRTTDRGVTWTR